MRKLLRNLSMLALMIVGGAQTASADETTTTLLEASGATEANWKKTDGSIIFTESSTYCTVTYENDGMQLTTKNGTESLLTTLTPDENVILNVEAEFSLYSNTGQLFSTGSGSYFRFGNIYILENDQDRMSAYQIAETLNPASATTFTQTGASYRSGSITTNASYYVTMEINTATNTLTSLKVYLTKSSTTPTLALSNVALPTTDYTVGMGYLKSRRMTTNQTELLKSIKVTQTTQEVQTASYTINYVYEGAVLDTKSGTTAVGSVIEATSPITIDEQKYYAADDVTTSLTVTNVEANNVLNVELRKAYEYNYTIKTNLGGTLSTGASIEGETVTVPYPRYINVDGILYSAGQGNAGYYKVSFIPTSNDYVHTINYSATTTENVIYFSEAEDIDGLTGFTGSNADIRCSNGAAAYNAEDPVTITTLQPGKYQLFTSVWGNSGATVTFKAGIETILEAETKGHIQDYNTPELTITNPTAITVEGGTSGKGIDFVYIIKTGDITEISIDLPTEYTYSTFSSTAALDFTNNSDVEAYTAKADGSTVTLTKVEKVPANTGLILKKLGDATTATVSVAESADAVADNDLVAVTTAISAADLIAAGNAYILVNDNQFAKVVNGASGELAAGKAYLKYGSDKHNAPMMLSFGETTAIKGVEVKAAQTDNAIYNLQGVRVSKPAAKGLYIINGKKHLYK